jgi:hypothetical protein
MSEETRIFQGLISTAQWIVLLGQMDISQAVTSLNHFNAAPQQGHLVHAFQIFGSLKHYKDRCIWIDPQPPMINHSLLVTNHPPDFTGIYLMPVKRLIQSSLSLLVRSLISLPFWMLIMPMII